MPGPAAPLLRAGSNLRWAARKAWSWMAFPRGSVALRVRLTSPVPETAPHFWPPRSETVLPLLEVLRVLEWAAIDASVACVVLRLEGPPGGWARALTLHRSVSRLRAAGKPVIVWSESYATTDYVVASAASHVLVAEAGGVDWTGLRLEGLFLRDLLAKWGVSPEVVRVGAFKSAGEMFTREGYSPEHREQLEALADEAWQALCGAVADGRGLDPGAVASLADLGPFTSDAALEAGLVDGTAYPDEIEARIREWVPALAGRDPVPGVDAPAYAWRHALPGPVPLVEGLPRIAYQVALGTVARGRGPRGIRSESLLRMLRRLQENPAVRGVVLRIDSSGGEVVASDLLWRGVKQLAAEKPVVACFGDTAASGAYYLAAGAREIVAEATTLTGSIGVVGGKVDLSGLLARVGVGTDHVERGARAGLATATRSFTADERQAVRAGMESAYDRFLERVSEGRGMEKDAVHGLAQGRVWSGAAAQEQGLVDVLGGPLEALERVRQAAGLGEGERFQLDVHPRISPFGGLRELLRVAG